MLHSPIALLVWEMFAKNRFRLILVAVLLPLIWSLLVFSLKTLSGFELNNDPLQFAVLFSSILYMTVMFSYLELQESGTKGGFPLHVSLLPVPTWLITSVPIVTGTLFIIGFSELWLYLNKDDAWSWQSHLTLWVCILTFVSWTQTLVWELLKVKILNILIGVAVFFIEIVAAQSILKDETVSLFGRVGGSLILACTLFSGCTLAYIAASRSRRGDSIEAYKLNAVIKKLGAVFKWRTSVPKFANGLSAQTWFMWRIVGSALPIMFGLAMMFIVGIIFVVNAPLTEIQKILKPFYICGPFLAAGYGTMNYHARGTIFLWTRPLTNTELTLASLTALAKSYFYSLAVLAIGCLVLLTFSSNYEIFAASWSMLQSTQGIFGAYLSALLFIVVITIIFFATSTAIMMLTSFFAGLDGKKSGWIIVVCTIVIVITWINSKEFIVDEGNQIVSYLKSAHFLVFSPLLIFGLLSFYLVSRFRQLSNLNDFKAVNIILGISVALSLLLVWQLALPNNIAWAISCLVTTLALIIFISIFLLPVIIEQQRHR